MRPCVLKETTLVELILFGAVRLVTEVGGRITGAPLNVKGSLSCVVAASHTPVELSVEGGPSVVSHAILGLSKLRLGYSEDHQTHTMSLLPLCL